MRYACKVCSSNLDLSRCDLLQAKCIFSKDQLIRYRCTVCGVIFGPIKWIEMAQDALARKYELLGPEGDTTRWEFDTFKSISDGVGGTYLNFGAGRRNRTHLLVAKTRNEMVRYDPFTHGDGVINSLSNMKYDGIISHNVIEHLQDPVKEFSIMKGLLKPGRAMAHSTPCYKYAYEYSSYHLFFYAGESIKHICDKVGLYVVDKIDYKEYSNVIFKST